jgi:hypothetical protein
VDFSPRINSFTDTIRLWMICEQHDAVQKGIEYIVESHRRGRTSSIRKLLQPVSAATCLDRGSGGRVPRTYTECEGDAHAVLAQETVKFEQLLDVDDAGVGAGGVASAEEEDGGSSLVVFTPPAVASADSFNVLKFYSLRNEVMQSVMATANSRPRGGDADSAELDASPAAPAGHHADNMALNQPAVPEFPFIPDEREHNIISQGTDSSILLVGRSGTGKTSIAVNRMWTRYRAWNMVRGDQEPEHGEEGYHQVFVTTNTVLRDQVRKAFQGMKDGFLGADADRRRREIENPPTLRKGEADEDMFPMFLTLNEYLRMLDGTFEEPFSPRNPDGSLKYRVSGGFHEEEGWLEVLPTDDDEWFLEDDDEDDDAGVGDGHDGAAGGGGAAERGGSGGRGGDGGGVSQMWKRREIDFSEFAQTIWPKMRDSRQSETKHMSPSSVFTEIHSYIKGSHLALDTCDGFLSREQYLRLPSKMCPTFEGLSTGWRTCRVTAAAIGT